MNHAYAEDRPRVKVKKTLYFEGLGSLVDFHHEVTKFLETCSLREAVFDFEVNGGILTFYMESERTLTPREEMEFYETPLFEDQWT